MKKKDTYNSLEEIQMKKLQLEVEVIKEEKKIGKLWNNLFHKRKAVVPKNKWAGLFSTGTGLVDGVLLGWKLYKKFKK